MKKIKNFITKKRKLLLTVILTALIILSSFGGVYAFMTVLATGESETLVTSNGQDLNTLNFSPGDPLSIIPGDGTLNQGMGNLHMSTTPKVTLTAVDNNRNISVNYYVYFEVLQNEYVYTTAESTPELILTILDPSGTEITNIDGLNHVTVGTVTGFDVTTFSGLVPIEEKRNIALTGSQSTISETWIFRLTMINLETNQDLNSDRIFKSNIIMQKEPRIVNESTDIIIANNGGESLIQSKTYPSFNRIPVVKDYYTGLSNTCEGAYCANTNNSVLESGMYFVNEGTSSNPLYSYYFRGYVDNNWLYFGGFYWRIIRINGDGSIRLIYSGTSAPSESESHVKKGSDTYINGDDFKYGEFYNSSEYVGFKYTLGESNGSNDISFANVNLDVWYENNLLEHEEFISDSVFCNDRDTINHNIYSSSRSGTGVGVEATWYNTTYRYQSSLYQPTLYCSDKEDSYTANNDSEFTNSNLRYPIGLITGDEAMFAGIITNIQNFSSYLYNGVNYWTMSPYGFDGTNASVHIISSTGILSNLNVTSLAYLRPVINLKSNVTLSGNGKWNNPYIVTGIN